MAARRPKIIYGGEEGNIISQYVTFCHVLNDQYRKLGYTAEAVREAIRICKDKNVLKEYLEEREGEVIDMMITLFDQETIRENYVAARGREAVEEADRKAAAKAEKAAREGAAKAENAAREAAAEAAAEADKTARADENLIRIKSLMANMKLSAQDAIALLTKY